MQKIEISSRTILFTVATLLFIYFLFIIKDLLFALFVAFIVASALKPFVARLVGWRLPRTIAVIAVYFLFIGFFVVLSAMVVPPLLKESTLLFKNLPTIIDEFTPLTQGIINVGPLTQDLPNLTNQAFNVVSGAFSNVVFVMSILFFGFYFLVEEDLIKTTTSNFLSQKDTVRVAAVIVRAQRRLNAWFWGELTLMTVVGLMTFIGLSLIGIRYAVPLAVLAGLFEAIPNLGPTLSAVPAILIGFSQNYFMGFAALALAFVVQQLENNIVVPVVMKKVVGINPIVTLVVLIVGGKLVGILGVLLAIPATLFLETVLAELIKKPDSAGILR